MSSYPRSLELLNQAVPTLSSWKDEVEKNGRVILLPPDSNLLGRLRYYVYSIMYNLREFPNFRDGEFAPFGEYGLSTKMKEDGTKYFILSPRVARRKKNTGDMIAFLASPTSPAAIETDPKEVMARIHKNIEFATASGLEEVEITLPFVITASPALHKIIGEYLLDTGWVLRTEWKDNHTVVADVTKTEEGYIHRFDRY